MVGVLSLGAGAVDGAVGAAQEEETADEARRPRKRLRDGLKERKTLKN